MSAPTDTPSPPTPILVGGRPITYTILRSTRARHSSIQIHPRRGLEVVLPQRAPITTAATLLRKEARWLAKHADELHRATHTPPPLQTGARLPLRGHWYTIALHPSPTPRAVRTGDTLLVFTPHSHDPTAVRAQLERWYRNLARHYITDRVHTLRDTSGPPITRITIRDQQTRWASCSNNGSLSFNWRLVMAPPPVLDAVVAHELVHLTIPNHSRRFWSTLDQRFPQHRACRRWLHHNGPRLTL